MLQIRAFRLVYTFAFDSCFILHVFMKTNNN